MQVEGQVQALLARRYFLESDVDHLEQYLLAQRERITEVAAQLSDMVQRVPGGLADMRRPLMSAAAEPDGADTDDAVTAPSEDGPADAGPPEADDDGDDGGVRDHDDELAEITKVAGAGDCQPGGADSTPPSSAATPLFGEQAERG